MLSGEVKEEKKPDPIYIPPTGVNSPQPVGYIGRSQRPVHRNQTNDSSFCDAFTCYLCLDCCSDCCHACNLITNQFIFMNSLFIN